MTETWNEVLRTFHLAEEARRISAEAYASAWAEYERALAIHGAAKRDAAHAARAERIAQAGITGAIKAEIEERAAADRAGREPRERDRD